MRILKGNLHGLLGLYEKSPLRDCAPRSGRSALLLKTLQMQTARQPHKFVIPYRRLKISQDFKGQHWICETGVSVVEMGRFRQDRSRFKTRFEPCHPAANDQGLREIAQCSTLD